MTGARQLHAACHCGTIRVTLDWPDAGAIPARACGCGLCTRHGAAWTSHPGARFRLHLADPAKVQLYRFGTRTADFHVCTICGVIPIVTCTIEGTRYAVFNVNTLDGVDRSRIVAAPRSFEGETESDRLARRRRNWTPEASDAG